MKTEFLLGVLGFFLVTGDRLSICNKKGNTNEEPLRIENCTLQSKDYETIPLSCVVITEIESELGLQAAVIRGVAKIRPKFCEEKVLGDKNECLSIRNISFECCYQIPLKKRSEQARFNLKHFLHILQFGEPLRAFLIDAFQDGQYTGLNTLAVYASLTASKSRKARGNAASYDMYSFCTTYLNKSADYTLRERHATGGIFPRGTEDLSSALSEQVLASSTKRPIFITCSFLSLNTSAVSPRIAQTIKMSPLVDVINWVHFHLPLYTVGDIYFEDSSLVRYSEFYGHYVVPHNEFSRIRTFQRLKMKDRALKPQDYIPSSPFFLGESFRKSLMWNEKKLHCLLDHELCTLPALEVLSLELCSLKAMYGSPFSCLAQLVSLELYNNELTTLSAKNFEGLSSLKKLRLTKNMIAFRSPSPVFSPLLSLDILHLGENKVEILFPEIFVSMNVSTLSLSFNLISNWSQPIFSHMARLENLQLDSNKIKVLDDTMYLDIADLPSLDICNNPWDCSNCSVRNVERLLFQQERQVCCENRLLCSGDNGPLANSPVKTTLPSTEACRPPDYYVIIGLPVILGVLVSSVTGYALYVNRWYIRYSALFLRVKVQGYRRHKSSEQFLWDAFISYHSSDADWVREHVVPTLESSTLRFRVCIGERDFIPGMPIVENVYRAIAQSRKSLFVLSREFCASRWCTFELTLAQHRLFESDRENQLVFIMREEIAESEMCSLLKYMTKTMTYVQVPPTDSESSVKDFFWLQLRAALQF